MSKLDITSGNKFNENLQPTIYLNGLAKVFTQEVNSDNEARKLRRAQIIDLIQKHLGIYLHLCAKPLNCGLVFTDMRM